MVHGSPDYSNVQKGEQIYRLDDMAELAARLGSMLSFDRRGDFLWGYDFREGLGDIGQYTSGAGASISLTEGHYYTPPFAALLKSGTTLNGYARLIRDMSLPPLGKTGFSTTVRAETGVDRIVLFLIYFDGTNRFTGGVRLDQNTRDLDIYVGVGTYSTIFTNIPLIAGASLFANLKLVCDLATKKYTRLTVDNIEYDLSSNSMAALANTTGPHITGEVWNYNTEAVSADMYVDNLIFTANEP